VENGPEIGWMRGSGRVESRWLDHSSADASPPSRTSARIGSTTDRTESRDCLGRSHSCDSSDLLSDALRTLRSAPPAPTPTAIAQRGRRMSCGPRDTRRCQRKREWVETLPPHRDDDRQTAAPHAWVRSRGEMWGDLRMSAFYRGCAATGERGCGCCARRTVVPRMSMPTRSLM